MAPGIQTFKLSPAVRPQWRRAVDELLIDAIFGDLPARATFTECASASCDEQNETPPLLVAAE